jgi:glycosyltransferase involved in cell wall biosynthesis
MGSDMTDRSAARGGTDVLMVTYNRPAYTRRALGELIRRSAATTRIWVWHNGNDEETLAVVREFEQYLHRFHHSQENVRLTEPTNWLFENADGAYLGKVDDDCIVPEGWDEALRGAHEDELRLGVIGCWRFADEDFVPELAARKIRTFGGGRQLLVNMWIEGSGYLMKRECFDRLGPLRRGQSFTDYCIQIGRNGWVNGWIYPFLHQEHMDDPRAEHTGLRSDSDLLRALPLSARRSGVASLEDWLAQLRRSAREVQTAPIDPAYWSPMRRRLRRLRSLVRGVFTGISAVNASDVELSADESTSGVPAPQLEGSQCGSS